MEFHLLRTGHKGNARDIPDLLIKRLGDLDRTHAKRVLDVHNIRLCIIDIIQRTDAHPDRVLVGIGIDRDLPGRHDAGREAVRPGDIPVYIVQDLPGRDITGRETAAVMVRFRRDAADKELLQVQFLFEGAAQVPPGNVGIMPVAGDVLADLIDDQDIDVLKQELCDPCLCDLQEPCICLDHLVRRTDLDIANHHTHSGQHRRRRLPDTS